MEAFELYTKEGKKTGVFCCQLCRTVHRTEQEANDCCVCLGCRANIREKYKTLCKVCSEEYHKKQDAIEKQKEVDALNKAIEVKDWKYVWFNDRMYEDIDIIIDDCDGSAPEFVFVMKPVKFSGFDINNLLDNYAENIMVEDFGSTEIANILDGYDELEKQVNEFNDANKNTIIYWIPDYTKKVRVE